MRAVAVEEAWLAARRDDWHAVITGLVEQADRFHVEEPEWLDELAIDRRDDDVTPATMVILDLAAAELRTAPAALGLEATRPCTVHALLARADNLRRQFAELGCRTARCAPVS